MNRAQQAGTPPKVNALLLLQLVPCGCNVSTLPSARRRSCEGGEGEEGPETAVGERLVKGVSPEGMRAVTGCEGQARAGPGSGGAAFSMAGARPLLIAPSGLYSLSPAYDHPSPPVAAAKPTRGVRAHCREKAR